MEGFVTERKFVPRSLAETVPSVSLMNTRLTPVVVRQMNMTIRALFTRVVDDRSRNIPSAQVWKNSSRHGHDVDGFLLS
jgi:hypothetical protein